MMMFSSSSSLKSNISCNGSTAFDEERILYTDADCGCAPGFSQRGSCCSALWTTDVELILLKLGVSDSVIEDCTLCDLDLIEHKSKTLMMSEWLTAVESKPKLRSYKMFKMAPSVESYLSLDIPKGSRSLCAQLRSGVLPLCIETGRYQRLDVNLRRCEVCETGDVEDEFHFVCLCEGYRQDRETLYEYMSGVCEGFALLTEAEQFVKIMQNCNQHVIRFICNAWQTRRGVLYH